VLTNTFGANRLVLQRHGLGDKTVAVNTAGVEISRRAAGDRAAVFASLGPSGKMLMTGEVSSDELRSVFAEQAKALADAGADGLVIETMADLEEAKLALDAGKETGLPVVACLVYDSGKDLDRTMMGTTPEQAAEGLETAGADAIGANCGQGIEGAVGLCRRLKAACGLPVWIKPNAGVPEMVDGQVVYRTTPQQFAGHIPALVAAGVDFVGGCCGTTSDFIAAIAGKIHR
jgi:methionine synthase I (cobalamin-dependent)